MRARVYTRHSATCSKANDPNARTWARCKCPKWLTITDDDGTRRKSAKTRSWEKAEATARHMEAGATGIPSERQTIAGAANLFLADRRVQNLSASTMYKHSHMAKMLTEWAHGNALVYLDELKLAHLEKFRAGWKGKALTRKIQQQRLSTFFNYCLRHKWLPDNPARLLSSVKAEDAPTLPFTKPEFEKLIATIPQMYRSQHGTRGDVGRARMLAMVLLLRWSGLRIGDAISLERSKLQPDGRLFLKMAKTGEPIYVLLPQDVTDLLHKVQNSNPLYFFWTGRGLLSTAVNTWQDALRRLFVKADLGKRCFPHMFRDTFAVGYLVAGMPIDQVSMLLGHASVKVTEKHYLPFVKARQDQLEASIRKAWEA